MKTYIALFIKIKNTYVPCVVSLIRSVNYLTITDWELPESTSC